MRRLAAIFLMSLCMVMVLASAITAQDQPVFRIGVLDNPRGELASGAALAVRQINNQGGAVGADGTRFRLELIYEYPEADETLAAPIERLSTADVIAVLGPITTEDALSYLPQLQALGVPVLTPALGDTVLATDTSDRLFRIRAAERLIGEALANLLVNELNVGSVTTVQLDRNSTGGRVGFSIALQNVGPTVTETSLLLQGEMPDLVTEVATAQPLVVVAFGEPSVTAEFYNLLRDAGWVGVFAYPQAYNDTFREAVSLDRLLGVIGTTTWPVAAVDARSTQFVTDYIRTFGDAPGSIEAAAYDAVNLIVAAIQEPGSLRDNLAALRDIDGVQGVLNRTGLLPGEMSDSVAVLQLNALGGPDIIARYASSQRLEEDVPAQIGGTPQPSPSPTPDGVFITIESARQNVRTGPGTNFDILGQLQQGEQRRIIGANVDFSWVVIEYRGQNGWLSASIADIFGTRETVPVITPPPTPTPLPATSTPIAPTAPPVPDLVVVSASPPQITSGVLTVINVTVANQGGAPAGAFAVAATFPPDNTYVSATVNGLAAGQQQAVTLPVTLDDATGNFNVTIVADLNNQVSEGTGEGNNSNFTFNYKVDRQAILINSTTLSTGGTVDLEGNVTPQNDLVFDASGLNTGTTCTPDTSNCIGILSPALTFDTAHYDAITASNLINQSAIPNAQLIPGTTLGVITTEGRRAVVRVDAINPGVSITLTWRVYQ